MTRRLDQLVDRVIDCVYVMCPKCGRTEGYESLVVIASPADACYMCDHVGRVPMPDQAAAAAAWLIGGWPALDAMAQEVMRAEKQSQQG